jgi:tripartite ATP-independent transporter DctP family solute receptor
MAIARRTFAGAVLAAPLVARAQARALRFGHVQAADHANNLGGQRAAAVIAERSGGRLRLDLFPAAQLGRGQEMVQQVADGTLDFAVDGPALLSQWVRPLSMFEAPYLARDPAHFRRMWDSPQGQALRTQLIERRGIRPLAPPWYFGTRHMTSNRPIRTPADLRGFKLRVPEVPLYVEMARALGAAPTPMAFAEVYLGLQTGTVDGQENPLPTIWSARFHEVQRYINLTGHVVLSLIPMISERTWQSLPQPDRDLVVEAFAAGAAANDESTNGGEASLVERFRAANVQVIEVDKGPFRAAMQPVYARFANVWGAGTVEALAAL